VFLENVPCFRQVTLALCCGFCGNGLVCVAICGKKRKNNPAGSVFTRIRRNPKNGFLAPTQSRLLVKSHAKEVSCLGNISGRFVHFGTFLTKIEHFEIESMGFDGLFDVGF
jgi:hypothetical protein